MVKKLVGKFLIGVVVVCGVSSAYASCFGPICWDDTGLYVTAGLGLLSMTKTNITAAKPSAAGVIVYCNNCTSSLDAVCIASGTGQGAFVKLSSQSVRCQD